MSTDALPTAEDRRIECPQCGSKLPDIPVSLCPYCASPLETAADRKRLESVNASRIGRVRDHADFPGAVAWDPPENSEWHLGSRMQWWTRPIGLIGVVLTLLVVPPVGRGFDAGGIVLALLALACLGGAAYLWVKGGALKATAVERPVMKRPGLIVDRRSDTQIRGWSGYTTYYFKIELEDGVVGEFRYPGLGSREDPYATNLPGVAYTRGADLLHFRHVRV